MLCPWCALRPGLGEPQALSSAYTLAGPPTALPASGIPPSHKTACLSQQAPDHRALAQPWHLPPH